MRDEIVTWAWADQSDQSKIDGMGNGRKKAQGAQREKGQVTT